MPRFRSVRHWIRRWPLAAYVLLVFGLEWLLVLAFRSVATPMVALFIGAWLPNIAGSATGIYGIPALLWLVAGLWWIVAAAIMVLDWARVAPRRARRPRCICILDEWSGC